jgi:hypothetical protein
MTAADAPAGIEPAALRRRLFEVEPYAAGGRVESRVRAEPEAAATEIFGSAARRWQEVMIVGVDGRQASPQIAMDVVAGSAKIARPAMRNRHG